MKTIFLSLILIISFGARSETLVMKITNPQINGNQVIFDVSADYFTNMVGMQYSILYDPAVMTYVTIQNFNLPDLTLNDFNSPTPGVLLNSWVKRSAGGVSLENGTLIYQIVFEMVNSNSGSVCFSEDPLQSEFILEYGILTAYNIIDGCHFDPFQINLTTNTEDIANRFGINIENAILNETINFTLADEQSVEFRVFDILGKQNMSFPNTIYSAGEHTLDISSSIIPGIYILTAKIHDQLLAVKVLKQ